MSESLIIVLGSVVATLAGLALLAAARWQSQVTRRWPAGARISALLVPGWILTLLGTLGIFVLAANVVGIGLWLALIVVLLMALTQRRIGQRRALLRLLAAATRSGQPLERAVRAFAQEARGPLGQQTIHLSAALESGEPLGRALPMVAPLASKRAEALLYLGQQTNDMSDALLLAADEQEPDSAAGEIMAHLAYLFWIVVFAATIVTFVMLKIVPAFRQIFEDFGIELPAITLVLINLGALAAHYWPLVLLAQMAMWAVLLHALLIFVGWVQWRMPLPLPWLRGLETSAVLRGLAMTAEAHRPLDQALHALGAMYPDAWVRGRLEQAARDVSAGLSWWDSLRQQRLISEADHALLHAAQRVGNVPWALRTIAQRHRWRLTYRIRWWLHLLAPPLLVALALVVGFIVIGLFMPLIKILEALT